MKLIRNTLLLLYVNLFMVILLMVKFHWLLITVIVISGIANVIFAVKNIINTYELYKAREYNLLRNYMKKLKLGAVPYFIFNFFVCFFLFMISFVASRGIVIFTPIPLFFIIPTYLTALFTSCYGIAFVVILRREKKIETGIQLIHIVLQVCFVLDVIDTIILLIKYKVEEKNS